MEPLSTGPCQPPDAPFVPNFRIVWLDRSIDRLDNEDCLNSIKELERVFNIVNVFIDVDECIDFITDNNKQKTSMIISQELSQHIVPIVQDVSNVSRVYILCENNMWHKNWSQQWSKVKGVFTSSAPVCEALKQAAQGSDQDPVSISFVKTIEEASTQTLDQLDQSFMYTQILKEILLTIDFDQKHIDEFLTYCREQFVDNTIELSNVEKLQNEYYDHHPIWWYTSPCSLHSMLNRALRRMDVDLIIKMGMFIRDLHKHIMELHSEQYGRYHHWESFIVYRGQGLSHRDFEQLMKTTGGLLSFNNFLSTSLDRKLSLAFAESNQYDPDMIGILFKITINPTISSSSFANVGKVSYYKGEQEILFSMHSIFRIVQVRQIDGKSCLWKVNLTLTDDDSPQLHALAERIREETASPYQGWHRLCKLMIKIGQFKKAEELYELMLKQTTNVSEKADLYHHLGYIKSHQGKSKHAIEFYEKTLEICQKILPANHSDLANIYNNIGTVYNNVGEYAEALSYYEKALQMKQKTLLVNHLDLAISYNDIGVVYGSTGEHLKALSYHEKALEIKEKTLPVNHPDLATSYNNIGVVYDNMGKYSIALSYHEKALKIQQEALPATHPSLAIFYSNIGRVYNKMGEHSKALSSYEKALEIHQKILPGNDPGLATSYSNIGNVYYHMGEHSRALAYYERALDIRQCSLPANHPSIESVKETIENVKREL